LPNCGTNWQERLLARQQSQHGAPKSGWCSSFFNPQRRPRPLCRTRIKGGFNHADPRIFWRTFAIPGCSRPCNGDQGRRGVCDRASGAGPAGRPLPGPLGRSIVAGCPAPARAIATVTICSLAMFAATSLPAWKISRATWCVAVCGFRPALG